MCVWHRNRDLSLICKNKPSGGKGWSIYAKFDSKQIWALIWIDFVLVLLALCCVGINHQKKGDWKGKGGLGPCKTSTALRWEGNLFQVHLYDLIAFVLLFEDFGEAMGLKGQDWSRFGAWCQRGREKIKAKAINGSATTWEILKIVD